MQLRRIKDLSQYTIDAADTDIGKVSDFYFDDEKWVIRYIVVATGLVLSGRKVLISPLLLRHPAWSPLHIRANLTWEQVQNGPSVDLHKPVSRRHKSERDPHFAGPQYGHDGGSASSSLNPASGPAAPAEKTQTAQVEPPYDPADIHLRSAHEVFGYHLNATDGEMGHLEDFLFDDETWQIRYAIVDTRNWWPGKKILLSPHWIERVSWSEREIYVNVSREILRKSPEWGASLPLSRDYELRLHKHYGYAPYWTPEK